VKPATFTYLAPNTLEEAISLLAQHAPEGKPLAGGQSLIPMMNFRLAQPRYLIDLNRIPELSYIREADGTLAIGAMTRQFEAERSELVGRTIPLLTEALRLTGHPTIRHRGTIGGALAHADPAAELPAVALALDAELVARGPAGTRTIPAREFFLGPLSTALAPDELLVEVRIPRLPPGTGWVFLELSRRHGDFAIVGVAAVLTLAPDGRIGQASLALCGAGPKPVRAARAEAALAGSEPSEERFREAGEIAAQEIDPDSDLHASADYRRRVAAVLVRQALTEAHRRVTEGR
jgi:carbon-monoxide dehydrogenase medium subunit